MFADEREDGAIEEAWRFPPRRVPGIRHRDELRAFMRSATRCINAGGAYRSASPAITSVGSLILSSAPSVTLFFSGYAGPRRSSGGRLFSSNEDHLATPSGFAKRYDGESSRNVFGNLVKTSGRILRVAAT